MKYTITSNTTIEQFGFRFGMGILKAAGAAFLTLYIIAHVLMWFGLGRDNSDYSATDRSGMTVYTDALTGRQYLGVGSGLTPRIGPDGQQVVVTK